MIWVLISNEWDRWALCTKHESPCKPFRPLCLLRARALRVSLDLRRNSVLNYISCTVGSWVDRS